MPNKRRFGGWIRTLLNLTVIFPSVVNLARNMVSLISLEAQAVGKNLTAIIFCLMFFGLILLSGWICLMLLLFAYLVQLPLELIPCLWIIFGVHVLLLLIIGMVMIKVKKTLFFPETRRQCRNLCK